MSDINNIAGYYNLYDNTKNYTELLFRAGKVLQSKEVNEIQSILKNQIKNIGDTVLTNGDVIEGCQLLVGENSVTVTKGKIYLNGAVKSVEDTTVSITGLGTEVIGAFLKVEVITPEEDSDLLDVSTGYDNYNQDGAYRLKETVEITLNDENSTPLFTLVDGKQLNVNTSEDLTQLDKIQATLARRTFEESGNYKVSGLKLVDKNHSDDDKIYISVESGKAYVEGYEVFKTSSESIGLDRPMDLRTVSNEPKIYRVTTEKYSFNNPNVNSVNSLVAIVNSTQDITKGAIVGGTDYLPLFPVVEVISVKQGNTTYVQGQDFQLSNEGIDWSIGTNEPEPGTTYSVTWNYNKTMVEGYDYTLQTSEDGTKNLLFLVAGDKPVEGTTFLLDYDFKLYRRDVVSLDKRGNVIVTKGQPDLLRTVESPSVNGDSSLILGSVLLQPDSDSVVIFNNNTQAIPMLDLYKILDRLSSLELNQAISDLDTEAAQGENATELMGVFTDGFLGFTKSDLYHDEWYAALDLQTQELTLPSTSRLSVLIPDDTQNLKIHESNRLITVPYTEELLVTQPRWTGYMRINSYNSFPKNPVINLVPTVDNWVNTSMIYTSEGYKTTEVTLRRWWEYKNESWISEERAKWVSLLGYDGIVNQDSFQVGNTTQVKYTTTEEPITYMRQNPVNVTIENLEPFIDNIVGQFDGVRISLTPSESSYQGTVSGTLKADKLGVAKGTFTIPANTLCGTKKFEAYPQSTPGLMGKAFYTSNGTLRTTTETVWYEKTIVNVTDPLAQSFQFDTDHYLTSIELYFNYKDDSHPIIVQVRNMVNGYPGTTCYAEKVIDASKIASDVNSTIGTRVIFDDPVYCKANEQYCFTVLSNSDLDSLCVAESGQKDLHYPISMPSIEQPYTNGTLFSSSNNLTWTAHQSVDLKFMLYGAKFESNGSAVFKPIKNLDVDRILLASEEFIPTGCSISWQYSVNGKEYLPIETYRDRELTESAETITLKVTIKSLSNVSPTIASDCLIFAGFTNKLNSTYVSKNVYVSEGYNNVKQVVDLCLPANTNVNMYFSTDTTGTEWHPLTNTATSQKSTSYKTYTFEASVPNSEVAHNYRCKVVLTTTNKINRPKAKNLKSIMKTV